MKSKDYCGENIYERCSHANRKHSTTKGMERYILRNLTVENFESGNIPQKWCWQPPDDVSRSTENVYPIRSGDMRVK
jgi:hypothetical protein